MLRNASHLIINAFYALFRKLTGKRESHISSFVQSAGIGDAIIYINVLNILCKYFPFGFDFYINPSYINLLAPATAQNVSLKSNKSIPPDCIYINLSPHVLIGGSPVFLFNRSIVYFCRAFLRMVSIYVFNEYSVADKFARQYFAQFFKFPLFVEKGCQNVLICPLTSDKNKNLTIDDIRHIVTSISHQSPQAKFTIVAQSNFDLEIEVQYIWYDNLVDYANHNFDCAICSDSWLLHWLTTSNKTVILYSKDTQFLTFAPIVPVITKNEFIL